VFEDSSGSWQCSCRLRDLSLISLLFEDSRILRDSKVSAFVLVRGRKVPASGLVRGSEVPSLVRSQNGSVKRSAGFVTLRVPICSFVYRLAFQVNPFVDRVSTSSTSSV
jgi:hypothetical protein